MTTAARRALVAAMAAGAGLAAGCAGGRFLAAPSPHEDYSAMLQKAGIDRTALGQDWNRAGQQALSRPVAVATPFRETGYFPPEEAGAIAYRLELQRGRRLAVDVAFESSAPARLFVDLFRATGEPTPQRVAFLEADQSSLVYDAERDGAYLLRIQPELLRGGRFTLTQRTLATVRFPVPGLTTAAVQSLFGAARDAGARQHEGVDIFAARGTAVVAVVDGVARASTNGLGGNVVWLQQPGSGRTFYYAHLDRQAVGGMARVTEGEVVGYVGNSGNARGTSPHLHFGIYEHGPVDPLPFLRPDDAVPPPPPARDDLGDLVRVTAARTPLRAGPAADQPQVAQLARHAPGRLLGATAGWLRVSMPDGATGYIRADAAGPADRPIRRQRLAARSLLRERPLDTAPVVEELQPDANVEVVGRFADYELMRSPSGRTGWVSAGPAAGAGGR